MNKIDRIKRKIIDREVKIGVIGLGYVGLPLTIQFMKKDFEVIGFDIDKIKREKLNSGQSYIKHISKNLINNLLNNGFFATDDWSKIKDLNIIVICIPTPLSKENEPDLSFLNLTLESISHYINSDQLIILESTSYPGTTNELIVPMVKDKGFKIGKNFFVAYSPEREDPGNNEFTTESIPKIISGVSAKCLKLLKFFYNEVFNSTISVSSPETAEMTKLLENIYRAVNIGLVNEMKIIAHKMGIDIHEVIDAAATKPFGFTPFYPGPGIGGHCIPVDPFYLTWKAKQLGVDTHFIEASGLINNKMPKWVVKQIKKNLIIKEIDINKSSILIIGIGYKKNLDDIRESPSLAIIDLLINEGADVSFHDPLVTSQIKTRKYNFDIKNVSLTEIKKFDCVVIATDHDIIDYSIIEQESNLIIDTRGKLISNSRVVQV